MPRRGGGGRMGRSPSPTFARRAPPPPPPSRLPTPAAAAPSAVGQPRQPGLMANMASTAAGVAVGSAIGHTIGHAMTGGGGGGGDVAPAEQQAAYSPGQQYQEQPQVCQYELRQFLQCAETQHDISLCYGFNEALRECKINNGVQMQQ